MLKLTASYSKKVPAETEYSSQSYHCCVEIEIAEGLNQNQLDSKIHETFEMVRNSVEAEIHGTAGHQSQQLPISEPVRNIPQNDPAARQNYNKGNTDIPASPKQLNYLLSLASKRGITPQQIAAQQNVSTVDQLSRRQCSALIEQWKAA